MNRNPFVLTRYNLRSVYFNSTCILGKDIAGKIINDTCVLTGDKVTFRCRLSFRIIVMTIVSFYPVTLV